MKTLVRVKGLFINKVYSRVNNYVSRFQEETLLVVFYYFATTRAEALIKQTTAPIYKKLTTLNLPIIFYQLIMAWLSLA